MFVSAFFMAGTVLGQSYKMSGIWAQLLQNSQTNNRKVSVQLLAWPLVDIRC